MKRKMNNQIKGVIGIIVLIISAPFIINSVIWIISLSSDTSSENMDKGLELIIQGIVPWWSSSRNWLIGFGIMGAIIAAVILIILRESGYL